MQRVKVTLFLLVLFTALNCLIYYAVNHLPPDFKTPSQPYLFTLLVEFGLVIQAPIIQIAVIGMEILGGKLAVWTVIVTVASTALYSFLICRLIRWFGGSGEVKPAK